MMNPLMNTVKPVIPQPPLTGRKVFLGFLAGFLVVFAVNMTMVFMSLGTFPGLVVKNSYEASQSFNDRLSANRIQAARGWRSAIGYIDHKLRYHVENPDGSALPGLEVEAKLFRPAEEHSDQILTLAYSGRDYTANADLQAGWWYVEITASQDEILHKTQHRIWVPE